MKVLIVEDEIRLADALGQIMKEQNYHTDIVNDGTDGLYYGLTNEYDVIILDVMLPGMNGFQIVQKLRESRIKTPVLLLTARDDTSDKVKGLDKGADDYLTKPFIPEELLARIRALSRRQGDVFLDEMVFGDLSLDLSSNDLCCREKSIHLAFKEFEVLKLLMSNSGKIISKDTLITRVWGNDSDAEDNNVEAYISFLRKKLSFVGSQVEINTIRKVGYRLEGPK
ncbi:MULTISPECIES: response regulator transcription factor [Clostridia]|uniref:Stage 0 sporulation protein A homolog n=1 Tax=Lacrimispora xylanolytica TaxID=29375 RepID=A0ABY7AGI1_9FIRM|nr:MULTISPECIES: response regulator transcription factor [Clostridia]WAJ25852.1 response regulator transcription factor [Lacrimispora xylanolytica]